MKVVLFGATGMVGQGVLRSCLGADDVQQVLTVGRTATGLSHSKLRELVHADLFDYRAIESDLSGFDACFFCLGASAGGVTEAEYTRLNYELPIAAAEALARLNPGMVFVYVSGAGTDGSERGRVMWARVKGRTENALQRLAFKAAYMFRPGIIQPLHGERSKTTTYRWFYFFARPFLSVLRRLFPRHVLTTEQIALAMLAVVRDGAPRPVLEVADIHALTSKWAPLGKSRQSLLHGILRWVGLGVLLTLAMGSLALVDAWTDLGKRPEGERRARFEQSPQWYDGRFNNAQPMWTDPIGAILKAFTTVASDAPATPPPVAVDTAVRLATASQTGLRVTWFGHSSALIEVDGVNVLVDPIWTKRPSPVDWTGPERWFPPPVSLQELPRIDAVIISHDHYDHLDRGTIVTLARGPARFVVPLGIGAHLVYWGVPEDRLVELDWWQSVQLGALRVVATPARHASGRIDPQGCGTLWAGYALLGPRHHVWYSGDTGFHDALDEIGERFGPFDVTLIEAGQYDELWPDWHLGPELAVEAHRRVRGKVMIPVHWGLFKLANHGWTEPAERVLAAAHCREVDVLLPRPGEVVEPEVDRRPARWWPEADWRTADETPIVATRNGKIDDRMNTPDCSRTPNP